MGGGWSGAVRAAGALRRAVEAGLCRLTGRWEHVTASLLPDACVACGEVLPEGLFGLCEGCDPLALEVGLACPRCGEPDEADLCPRCRRSPPPFFKAWAPFEHEGAVARAVHRFKYEDRSDLSRPLVELLDAAARARGVEPHVELPGTLVPVPLHPARFRTRMFDQAALLAVELGRRWGRPVDLEALVRTRATTRQVGLAEAEREANVKGAFRARPRRGPVLLVDDVLTSGATAREASRALLDAGAVEVRVVTLARARRERSPPVAVAGGAVAKPGLRR